SQGTKVHESVHLGVPAVHRRSSALLLSPTSVQSHSSPDAESASPFTFPPGGGELSQLTLVGSTRRPGGSVAPGHRSASLRRLATVGDDSGLLAEPEVAGRPADGAGGRAEGRRRHEAGIEVLAGGPAEVGAVAFLSRFLDAVAAEGVGAVREVERAGFRAAQMAVGVAEVGA